MPFTNNKSLVEKVRCFLIFALISKNNHKMQDLKYLVPVNQRKNVEHSSHVWVITATGSLQVFQSLFTKRNCDFITTLTGVLNDQVVQCT